LANPEDPVGLAQQIKIIFSDLTIARKKGEESRLRCQKYYSIEAMAEILNKVLDRIGDSLKIV
jgi:glycosyltransferase involved in cell wall biosynthesis